MIEAILVLLTNEDGQDLIEYGLLALLVSVTAIVFVPPVADMLIPLFSRVAAAFP